MDNKDLLDVIEESENEIDKIEVTDFSYDINEILESVKEAIKLIIKNLYDSLKKINIDKETINRLIKDFCFDVEYVLKEADYQIRRLSSNDTILKTWEKMKETYRFIAERIVTLVKEGFNILMGNEKIKDTYTSFEKKGKVTLDSFNEKYKEFTHDPNVRKSVVSAVNTLTKLSYSVKEKVKDYLK